jgi:hypothetical protein
MFGQVHSVCIGNKHLLSDCKPILRLLHDDQMRRFRQSPTEKREKHAEQAAEYRDLMNAADIVNLVMRGASYGR